MAWQADRAGGHRPGNQAGGCRAAFASPRAPAPAAAAVRDYGIAGASGIASTGTVTGTVTGTGTGTGTYCFGKTCS